MGVFNHPPEQADPPKGHRDGADKKQRDFQQDQQQIGPAPGHTGHKGEGHQPQHVVDQGGGQNGAPHPGVQPSQLLEGLHRNAHRGSGEYGAQKDVFQQSVIRQPPRQPRQPAEPGSHDQGDQHAAQGHAEARLSGAAQLPQVGAHTGGKEDDNDPQLADLSEKGRLRQHIQQSGTQHQARQQGPDNTGHLKFSGDNADELGAEKNQRQIQQIMIGHKTPLSLRILWPQRFLNSLHTYHSHPAWIYKRKCTRKFPSALPGFLAEEGPPQHHAGARKPIKKTRGASATPVSRACPPHGR